MLIPSVVAFVAGYGVGALPVAWLLVRRRHGIDLRSRRGGGTGAASVLVVAGPTTAALAMALECAKGAAVALGAQLHSSAGWFVATAIAGCVVGDAFPPLYRRGGRGLLPLITGLIVGIPTAGAVTAVAAVPIALMTSMRGRLYEAVVAVAVPVGLVVGTRDWRSLVPAALIVAALLTRQAMRRRVRRGQLARRQAPPSGAPAWAKLVIDADSLLTPQQPSQPQPRQNPRTWET